MSIVNRKVMSLAFFFIIISSLSVWAAGGYEITGTAAINENAGSYVVAVEITSNLPEGAKLQVEVYYTRQKPALPLQDDPNTPQFEREEISLTDGGAVLEKGKCSLTLGNYPRRPYVGDYLVKVIFDPETQPADVSGQLPSGLKTIKKEIVFTYGKPEELEAQKKAVKRAIYEVMKQIKNLHQDLEQQVAGQTKAGKFNPEQWKAWSEKFKKVLAGISEDNKSRLEGWIYHTETVGKHTIDALAAELTDLAVKYEKKARTSDKLAEATQEFAAGSADFRGRFDDGLNMLGLDIAHDNAAVKDCLETIGKNLDLINNLYREAAKSPQTGAKTWAEQVPAYRTAIQQQLFHLADVTSNYIFATYTALFTQDFMKYLDTCAELRPADRETAGALFNKLKKTLGDIKETLEIE